jgi:sulfide:quinone oxidoreductase
MSQTRWRVAICGGGVAAIEALLAVRALLGFAPHVDLIAPNRRFVYEPIAVAAPFGLERTHPFELAAIADEHRAQLHIASLQAVEAQTHRITLSGGAKLAYDALLVAVGARRCDWLPGALHFRGASDVSPFRELLARLESDAVSRVVFAAPAEVSWTLPTYELALLTAARVAERHLTGIELTIVTPEKEPLAVFGPTASRAMRDVLADRGIRLRADSIANMVFPGAVRLASGDTVEADEVVALAELKGPYVPGLPAHDDGFIQIDDLARVNGLDDVYAAGDATAFPVKQGGIATQQADTAVESMAARRGAGAKPPALRPVLRGALLTGIAPTYLRTTLSNEAAAAEALAADPLWWPPTKIAGRYLGPYLAASVRNGEGASLEHASVSNDDPRAVQAGHREARELALTFALADESSEDFRSALRWLDVVEQLDGSLPPGFDAKRADWRARAHG